MEIYPWTPPEERDDPPKPYRPRADLEYNLRNAPAGTMGSGRFLMVCYWMHRHDFDRTIEEAWSRLGAMPVLSARQAIDEKLAPLEIYPRMREIALRTREDDPGALALYAARAAAGAPPRARAPKRKASKRKASKRKASKRKGPKRVGRKRKA